jgi:hypothetical protein
MPSTVGIVASGLSTPLELSPALWLDAADTTTITESSGSVSQWNDKSGNARHVVQTTAADQPTTGSETINGLNVLSFNSDELISAATTAEHRTIFIVADSDGAAVTQGAIWRHEGGNITLFRHQGTTQTSLRFTTRSTAFSATSVTGLTDPHILTARFTDQTNVIVRRNKTTLTTTNTALSQQAATGAIWVGGYLLEQFIGKIGEIITYSQALSDAELDEVETYLSNKWGI